MRITLATLSTCTLALLLTSGTVQAQPAPAAASVDPIASFRGRDVLGAQEVAAVRQAVESRVQALVEASQKNDAMALQMARKYLADAAGQGATASFRNSFAEVSAAVFPPYMGIGNTARGNDPRVALYLVQILGQLKQLSSLDAVLSALNSKHPAVRYWAARAVRDMRVDIAGRPGNLTERVMGELVKAGAKEGYASAAQVIYEAVDFRPQVPGAGQKVVAAWLEILSGRVQFYSNDLVTEFYPDANMLALLQISPDLTDADKKKASQLAYQIMEQCVQRWTAVARQEEGSPVEPENPYNQYSVRDWHLRYQLARTTQEVEVLLKKLRSAGASTPDVSGLMTTLSTAEQVHGAFEKWQAVIQPATASTPAAATQQALQK